MTIKEHLEHWATIVGGQAWGLKEGIPQIHIPLHRKDVKACFYFPNAVVPTRRNNGNTIVDLDAEMKAPIYELGNAVLRIEIGHRGISWAWRRTQIEKIMRHLRRVTLALAALDAEDECLAISIMDGQGDLESDCGYCEAANEIVNGRPSEARAILGI